MGIAIETEGVNTDEDEDEDENEDEDEEDDDAAGLSTTARFVPRGLAAVWRRHS
jgi:hypothetical protein